MNKLYEININLHDDNIKGHKLITSNGIDLFPKGDYIGVSKTWSNLGEIIIKTIEQARSVDFDKSKLINSKIYRFPKLTLPRDKVAILNEKYESRVIRDRDKCDIAVVSKKLIEGFRDHSWSYPTYESKHSLISCLFDEDIHNLKDVFDPGALQKIRTFIHKLNDDDKIIVEKKPHYYRSQGNTTFYANCEADKWINKVQASGSGYTVYIPEEYSKDYHWILSNIDKCCYDTELNELATEDSVLLDEDSFKQISRMIDSNEDRDLALETMANCNVEKSRSFLGLLFFFKWDQMKNAKTWNHVNFKALRTEFDSYATHYGYAHGHAYDFIIKKMVNDNVLTEFAVKVIAKKMFENVLSASFGLGTESVFNIDPEKLELRPEYKNKIITEAVIQDAKVTIGIDDLPF